MQTLFPNLHKQVINYKACSTKHHCKAIFTSTIIGEIYGQLSAKLWSLKTQEDLAKYRWVDFLELECINSD